MSGIFFVFLDLRMGKMVDTEDERKSVLSNWYRRRFHGIFRIYRKKMCCDLHDTYSALGRNLPSYEPTDIGIR